MARRTSACLALVATGALAAQSNPADSVTSYVQRARALGASQSRVQRDSSVAVWEHVATVYRSRRDTLGEAKALASALEIALTVQYPSPYTPRSLALMTRAANLFLAIGRRADAAAMYDVGTPVALVGLRERDTTHKYRLVALALMDSGTERSALRRMRTRASLTHPSADSALSFAQAAFADARAARDSLNVARALHALGNAQARMLAPSGRRAQMARVWRDSAATSLERAVAWTTVLRGAGAGVSRVRGALEIELMALQGLASLFESRENPPLQQLPAARRYMHRRLETARRFRDPREELRALGELADSFQRYGPTDSAVYYVPRRVALARAQPDTLELMRILLSSSTLLDGSAPQRAVSYAREAVRLARPTRTAEGLALSLMRLAQAHDATGHADSALHYMRRALDSTVAPTASGVRNQFLLLLASAFRERRQADSALAYYRQALRSSGSAPFRATAHNGIGLTYLQLGALDSANAALHLVLHEGRALPDQTPVRLALAGLARVQEMRGHVDSALILRRSALAGYRAAHDWLGQIAELRGIANLFRGMGRLDSAFAQFHAVRVASDSARNARHERSTLASISGMFLDLDVADSAMVYARLAMSPGRTSARPLEQASLEHHAAQIFLQIGQVDSARAYLIASLRHHRAIQSADGEASNLTSLGHLLLNLGRSDSAVVALRQALALRRHLRDAVGEVTPLLLLAKAFADRADTDSAEYYARSALRLSRRAQVDRNEALAMAAVGRALARRGSVDSARGYFLESLGAMRKLGLTRDVRTTLAEIADLFRASPSIRERARATAYYDSAAAIVDDARRGAGDHEDAMSFAELHVDVFSGWSRAWLARAPETGVEYSVAAALGAVERGRAQSLLDLLVLPQGASIARSTKPMRAKAGSNLAAEADSLLAPLRASRAAALTYLLAADTLFTWFLLPDGSLELRAPTPISETEFNRLVQSARRLFSGNVSPSRRLWRDAWGQADTTTAVPGDPATDWARLATLLIPDDFETKVPAETPVLIVPHGVIGLVPFAALERRLSADGKLAHEEPGRRVVPSVLGARNPVRYAPSFAALHASEQRGRVSVRRAMGQPGTARVRGWNAVRRPNAPGDPSTADGSNGSPTEASAGARRPLIVGNPLMRSVYSGRSGNRGRGEALPGAEAESHAIARMFGIHAVTGRDATESAVRQQMTSASVIHFATHGLAFGRGAMARRSYVALAADAKHDGFLTLGELMDDEALTFSAELVVLSSCQSGLGNLMQSEGTIGLQRGFLAKGARSVLVSLWNVDDKATRLLMEQFYAYWLDPRAARSKASALQMAQEAVRRTPRYAHPKYWAAFQLVGAE